MAGRLKSAGTDLDSIFQSYVSGDIIQTTTTNIQNGGTDISSRYAGRDNRAGNSASNVNITYGGTNISGLFNKSGATYDLAISGTVFYNGTPQAPTITHNPSNTPTQAILNPTTKTDAGNYTITGDPATGFQVSLPGNYLPGTYSGTFIIDKLTPAIIVRSYYFASFYYLVQVRCLTLASNQGIQYSDDAGGFIGNLNTIPQDTGAVYFYFTLYSWQTTSTTNFNSNSGSFDTAP